MSKVVKNAAGKTESDADLPFETALKRLESIVETMEGDDLPLEALLARFEEGTRLASICQAKLAEAEVKIQQLEQKNSEGLTLKPAALNDPPLTPG